ncbi:nuclear transport factor 2 family protein [Candidatus Riflebacteria bacterium]
MKKIILCFIAFFFSFNYCSAIAKENDKKLKALYQDLLHRNEIIERVNGIGICADTRDWKGVISCFADKVLLDYTSMVGGQPVELTPAVIVSSWKGLLPGFKMTQHQITNHRVKINDDEADCFSYVTAIHHLPNKSGKDTWTVWGYYNHHLIKKDAGWKVAKMKFTLKLIEGNRSLPQLAKKVMAERAKKARSK